MGDSVRSERILGAILAGGKSRRFGSDKAAALVDGIAMLDHVIAALSDQVDHIVICGREWKDLERVEDRPAPGMGPLGGLNGALAYAATHGFGATLTVPVDVLPVPSGLCARLTGPVPGVFEEQYLIGYWPVSYASVLDKYMSGTPDVAFHNWLDHVSARRISEREHLFNMNTQADFEKYKQEN